jgi:hypothetical protein
MVSNVALDRIEAEARAADRGGWAESGGFRNRWVLRVMLSTVVLVIGASTYYVTQGGMFGGGQSDTSAKALGLEVGSTRAHLVDIGNNFIEIAHKVQDASKRPGANVPLIAAGQLTTMEGLEASRDMNSRWVRPADAAVVKACLEVSRHARAYVDSYRMEKPDTEGVELKAAEDAFARLETEAVAPAPPSSAPGAAPGSPQ